MPVGRPAETDSAGKPHQLVAAKVRGRAVWSLSLFTAALPVAFLAGGPGGDGPARQATGGLLGTIFWGAGAVMAMLAAWSCIRNWPVLPTGTRWMGLLPAGGAALIGLLLAISVTFGGNPP